MDKPPAPGFNTHVQPPPPYSNEMRPPLQPQQITVVHPAIAFGPTSQQLTCPYCQAIISTRVEAEPNMKTHLVALLLCFLCICLAPCPYCMDSCLAKKHYCPSCNTYLGESQN